MWFLLADIEVGDVAEATAILYAGAACAGAAGEAKVGRVAAADRLQDGGAKETSQLVEAGVVVLGQALRGGGLRIGERIAVAVCSGIGGRDGAG